MLTADPDRYYTPAHLAERVAAATGAVHVRSVIDSNCGAGSLLQAAESVFPRASILGIDADRDAIRRLRTRRPHWHLVTGNALSPLAWKRLSDRHSYENELAVLNPPFSMGSAKGCEVVVWGVSLRCSLSMAHVISTINHANPKKVVAIVPESWAFSHGDQGARSLIEARYSIDRISSIKNSAFRGARANTILVSLTRRSRVQTALDRDCRSEAASPPLIRGGLPVFEARRSTKGIPFIHSTDLLQLASGLASVDLQPIGRGKVSGHVVLFPRVGLPKKEQLKAISLQTTVQLSDCVIALRCANRERARLIESELGRNFDSLRAIYKGTGARYVTVERLRLHLCNMAGL